MFSVIFPGQGSQIVGMGKEFFDKYDLVKGLFKEADDTLGFSLSEIILNGPKDKLDLTVNTQPAIFLISYAIFNVASKEFNLNLNKAKYFAGHSLGEYSALSAAGYLGFGDTLKLLRTRGDAMQNAVPTGEGGMVAQIANDNSEGQIVLSGKNSDLSLLTEVLKANSIKNIKLPVSAPFHCKLMNKATEIMKNEIEKVNFEDSKNILISNDVPYFIDQIEWVHSHEAFKIITTVNVDICNSLQTSLLLYESNGWRAVAYDEHSTALHERDKEIFEKGVRHGFWNIKTKEEIKEKYEKYKHLEDWYEP